MVDENELSNENMPARRRLSEDLVLDILTRAPYSSVVSFRLHIRASSKGLVCCESVRRGGLLLVHNPVTGDRTMLPTASPTITGAVGMIVESLDPYDYQVVRIAIGDNVIGDPFGIEIFDSKLGAWAAIGKVYNVDPTFYSCAPLYINGSFHWLYEDKVTGILRIMMFKMKGFQYNPDIELPELVTDYGIVPSVRSYGVEELLGVVYKIETLVEIWAMTDYSSRKWIKKLSINFRAQMINGGKLSVVGALHGELILLVQDQKLMLVLALLQLLFIMLFLINLPLSHARK
ncbi:hypothetical protein AMTRI_Chr02g261840 [Amborella trichopoda]